MIKLKDLFNESGILYRAGVKKYGKEGMAKILSAAGKRKSHAEIGKIKDKYEKDKKESVKEAFVNNLKQAISYIHTDTKDGAEFMKLMKQKSYNKKQAIRAFTLAMRGDAVHGAGPGGTSQFAMHVTKHLQKCKGFNRV